MTEKDKIKQYIFIKDEIIDLEQRILKDKEKLRDLENSMVTDSVACGKKGKKPIRNVKITGFPSNEYSKRKAILYGRLIAREKHKTKLEEMESNVEEIVMAIDDAVVRMIVRYKYIDCLTWEQVAAKISGGNTVEGVRKKLNRYLSKNNTCTTMSEMEDV